MTTRSTKSLLIGAMASLALALGVTEADAQNFNTSNGSTYAVPAGQQSNTINGLTVTGGTIRMRSSQGTITGKYGATKENRMPGTVIWYCNSTIPGGTFFTDLSTGGGGTVTVGTGDQPIDISGSYTPGKGGDDPGNTGKRNYPNEPNNNSNIVFSGGGDDSNPQVIPNENTDNGTGFNIVTISGDGTKSSEECSDKKLVIQQLVRGADATGAVGKSTAKFINKTKLTLAKKEGAEHSAYHIENNPGGSGDCGITLAAEAKLTTENYTNTSGYWTLEDNSTVNLNGTFTYTEGNMNFACSSNFNYLGTNEQNIVGTGSTTEGQGFYSYGNISFANSTKTASGNFRVCNDLKTSSEVKLLDFTATMLNKTPNNHVFFVQNALGQDVDVEIEGRLEYLNPKANEELTFNNKHTKVKFEESGSLTSFALFVKGATPPTEATPINPLEDVSRKINVTYAGSGKISHFATMWEDTDELNGFVAPTPGTPIRFAEGYDRGQERKKLIRVGATYSTDLTNRLIAYGKDGSANGIFLDDTHNPTSAPTNSNDLVAFNQKLASGSDILLSTKTQKAVSVLNGRWSNPATWDTGLEPASNDDVEIRTTVWIGDKTALFGGSAYEEDERAITNANATDGSQFAARSITIENVVGAGLYMNINDETLFKHTNNEIVFKTHMEGEADKVGIFNKNTNTESATPNTGSPTGMNGIFLSAVTSSHIPVLGAANWNNEGTFTNNGVAEVGICK